VGVKAIGIDLGTTNSVVSIFTEHREQPATLTYADDACLVPSVVHWDPHTKKESVGREAFVQSAADVAQMIRSTKRTMGQADQCFTSNGKTYTPEQTASTVLQYLASHEQLAEEYQTHGALWAVITVPAHFDDAARSATIAAAESANISVLRIVNEPTAAALAYSMLPDVRHLEKETLVVYDLGGGTFDVSVVERDGLIFNVLASEGDVQLGGDDLDHALVEHLLTYVTPQLSARRLKPGTDGYKSLLLLAEQAKKQLQSEGQVHVSSKTLDDSGAAIDCLITRDVFESLAHPVIQKTLALTERAIHAARKKAKSISRILLVGGSTRVTLVRRMLEQYFPHCQVDARLEPDLAVSWGAAIQAAMILGLEPNTILVDVCSHSLGVGVAEDSRSIDENFKKVAKKYGLLGPLSDEQLHTVLGDRVADFQNELRGLLRVAPIIHRNSALPSKRSEFFTTLYENQMAVQVIVVQGEGERVAENRLIGTFLFPLRQPCPAGTQCEIQLTYDQNGMVHVLAKQLPTNNQAEAVFDSRTGEVTGWVSVTESEKGQKTGGGQGFELARELESGINEENQEAAESSHPEKAKGSVSQLTLPQNQNQHQTVSPSAQNAILVRAKRHLMRLGTQPQRKQKLLELISQYESLLERSFNGEDCDNEMETLEIQLEEALKN
jgi:molecular chaperone DnaK